MTLLELLGINVEKMTSAFGRYWRTNFVSCYGLGLCLHLWPWIRGGWSTVLGGGDDPSSEIDTPQKDLL